MGTRKMQRERRAGVKAGDGVKMNMWTREVKGDWERDEDGRMCGRGERQRRADVRTGRETKTGGCADGERDKDGRMCGRGER
ncbi:hypothetical protein NDU88_002909 [Pleurodeles waltl]|uniref:Uncharacterized protein n=1 Tax=Pleurodeles waltl TaxID=8319 RepID=A0AAV7UCA0_PLEWA|nr:hypothetical protein NDU88_002909 [Pleurodeles waltl]